MTAFVALLRAINVGGNSIIKMAALKALCEDLGFTDVRTLLQSGNVVFRAKGTDATIAKKLADAIVSSHGFRPAVIVRTAAEIGEAISGNPFADAAKNDPGHLVVAFTEAKPVTGASARLAAVKVATEQLKLGARELYVHYAGGIGTSKVTNAALEKALGVAVTGRNWNTVTKLQTMLAEMAA